jgi:hypothetical protein
MHLNSHARKEVFKQFVVCGVFVKNQMEILIQTFHSGVALKQIK